MQIVADRPEAPTAIRTDLGAIFVSLELSRSTWLITSLSPGGGEKMSKHRVRGRRHRWRCWRAFRQLKEKALARTGKSLPDHRHSGGRAGRLLDSSRAAEAKASRATSSIRPRSRPHAGAGGRRPTGSTARRWFARCWRTSAANRGSARWSGRRRPRRRTAAGSAASARR